mgnify:CR=1 FL=1
MSDRLVSAITFSMVLVAEVALFIYLMPETTITRYGPRQGRFGTMEQVTNPDLIQHYVIFGVVFLITVLIGLLITFSIDDKPKEDEEKNSA